MASQGNWFGRFKTDLADEFDSDAVAQMSMYFSLPPKKIEQVKHSQNCGLELLSVLEATDTIGQIEGIDKLCKALKYCNLDRIARVADTLFNEPRDIPDGPGTNINLQVLEDILHDELTPNNCYEIAMSLGLRANFVQEIRKSENSSSDLIQKLRDGNIISGSNINPLLFALKNRQLNRVAKLIQESKDLQSYVNTTESSKGLIAPTCTCEKKSFEELRSGHDESVVSLRCENCPAEWFSQSEFSDNLCLIWKNNTYYYKIVYDLDLSKLKHDQITNVNELHPGDHIVFRRLVLYDHHAIFISDGGIGQLEVIHWTSQMKPSVNAVIKHETLPRCGVRRVTYLKSDPADVVIARAFDMLNNSKEKYDLETNNCESLATYCKIGRRFSIQGETVGDVLPFLIRMLRW